MTDYTLITELRRLRLVKLHSFTVLRVMNLNSQLMLFLSNSGHRVGFGSVLGFVLTLVLHNYKSNFKSSQIGFGYNVG